MEIQIYTDSKKKDKNYEMAISEYAKRLTPFCKISVKKVKAYPKPELSKDTALITVIPGHNSISSPDLAKHINELNINGISKIIYIIFDSAEQSDSYLSTYEIADTHAFCLSSFSMSKELTTVVLCEQIYRAYTILNNITYHK